MQPGGALDDLTPREAQLLELMSRGRSNTAIGRELGLSDRTVETHVASIYRKLAGLHVGPMDRRVVAVLRYLEAAEPTLADAA